MKVRIGTRGSDLALWQAHHVSRLLAECGVETEIVVLQTRGDLIDDVPLQQLEGKAFFTAEIERALLDRRVDLAVHSHKDLPTEDTPGLVIAAVPQRGPQGERLLIAPDAHDEHGAFLPLRRGARVGTSAPRRNEQLRTLRPDLEVLDLRGNVPTRVRRLAEGRYDAIVLACAGLDRLELDIGALIAVDLPADLLTPAPAQGALALQVRASDSTLLALCRERLHDIGTARAIEAERSLLTASGGGCSLPLGAAVTGGDPRSLGRGRRTGPPPHIGGTNERRRGVAADVQGLRRRSTDSARGDATPTNDTPFVARAFLGAGHPAGAQPAPPFARWATAVGATAQAAIDAAQRLLASGAPTHCGPFAGLRVALAGSASDGSVLGERLAALGADVLQEQLIEITPIAGVDLGAFLAQLTAGDVLAVTSRQAARCLAGVQLPSGVTIAAVGRASARTLDELGLTAAIVGDGGGAELAQRLALPAGAKVLWPCAEEALPEFEHALRERSIEVRRLAVYRTSKVASPTLAADVHARVYMSPSAVEAALAWERAQPQNTTRRYALGHATAEALRVAELEALAPSCDAGPITEALVAELWRHVRSLETAR